MIARITSRKGRANIHLAAVSRQVRRAQPGHLPVKFLHDSSHNAVLIFEVNPMTDACPPVTSIAALHTLSHPPTHQVSLPNLRTLTTSFVQPDFKSPKQKLKAQYGISFPGVFAGHVTHASLALIKPPRKQYAFMWTCVSIKGPAPIIKHLRVPMPVLPMHIEYFDRCSNTSSAIAAKRG